MCIEKEQRDSVGMCLQGVCVCVCASHVLSLVCFISLYCKIDVAHCGACAGVCVCPVIVTQGRESDTEGGAP